MAEAILGKAPNLGNPSELRERIKKLEADRNESNPAWWNDLAGAHIRLGDSKTAAKLLESVVARFPDDYGIHANLGTAYHLLGRYVEAEKEIARDLEINPNAHFGLEVYHLALLQYLNKAEQYRKTHLYVDEFSKAFLRDSWSDLSLMSVYEFENPELYPVELSTNNSPGYRLKWDLANNTNRQAGVIYMASMNPREPACFVMLGVECLAKRQARDLNLALAAFQKAIQLGSPQKEILEERIHSIKSHISTGQGNRRAPFNLAVFFFTVIFAAVLILWGITKRTNTIG
jgi:tetratricopeptide (TPR) repeat protein